MNRKELVRVASHYSEKELNIASSVLADTVYITDKIQTDLLTIIELMKQHKQGRL